MKNVSIFVDVQNIYYTARETFKKNFDYNAFWKKATEGRSLVSAYAYAVDRGDEKQKQFQNILRAIGFEVRLKPYIQRSDGSSKGDWDVGITIDIMESVEKTDVIVLVSGDGDFSILVDKMRKKYNKEVEVYSVEKLTASSLISAATTFFPISDSLLL